MNTCLSELNRAILSNHVIVNITTSKTALIICKLLYKVGLLSAYYKTNINKITVQFAAYQNKIVIQKIKRISTPGHRIFLKKKQLINKMHKKNYYLVSTTKGLILDQGKNIEGGEVICMIA